MYVSLLLATGSVVLPASAVALLAGDEDSNSRSDVTKGGGQ